MSARRLVDRALAFEAMGYTPEEAFEHACDQVTVSPSAQVLAARILGSLERRAGRVEVVLPDRDRSGRFVGVHRG